jgi:hypothetical protein
VLRAVFDPKLTVFGLKDTCLMLSVFDLKLSMLDLKLSMFDLKFVLILSCCMAPFSDCLRLATSAMLLPGPELPPNVALLDAAWDC